MYLPTGFKTVTVRELTATERDLKPLIPAACRDTQKFAVIDQGTAFHIISIIEKTMEFSDSEFEWDAMRGLLDYYSDVRDGGDGKVLLLAETGRKLSREKSGDKSGLSILGGGVLRGIVLDPQRSKTRSRPSSARRNDSTRLVGTHILVADSCSTRNC